MVKITSENLQWQKSVKQRPTQKQDEGKSSGNDFCSANTKPKPDHIETKRSSNKIRAWNEISPVWVPTAEKEKNRVSKRENQLTDQGTKKQFFIATEQDSLQPWRSPPSLPHLIVGKKSRTWLTFTLRT
jgi:anion-transporting  ArsA/GET3 family ATPase